MSEPASYVSETSTSSLLKNLPAAARPVDIAVYEFSDLTGQYKPNEGFAEYSRAVTQGADAILVDVLADAGRGQWFNVVERRGLPNLLRERQVIQATRQQFNGQAAAPLPPLTFAGVIIEGGIIAYETNLSTGGAGARYLGIGVNSEYRTDLVTINLRLVSVQTGRILNSITTTKKIYSVLVQGSVFKYIAADEILELEAGYTRNDPPQLAVREAIELAVYTAIIEGAERDTWEFADSQQGRDAIYTFQERVAGLPPSSHDLAAQDS
ncbi:CsgG/HfaB family protein [Onishia taeanensis]|jgi:curli production assembly/transport component CsgG|nr:CsgG/HfaB family protein [Halomonas taeanensis]